MLVSAPGLQVSEPHVAVDPADGRVAYVAYNSTEGNVRGTTVSATRDGGQTWSYTNIATLDPGDRGDPVVAVDPVTHDLWHVYIGALPEVPAQCGEEEPTSHAIRALHAVHDSAGNLAWQPAVSVHNPAFDDAEHFLDKPWLTIAPNGTIAVTYTVEGPEGSQIAMSVSSDHGATWGRAIASDAGADHFRHLGSVSADRDGNFYVVWYDVANDGRYVSFTTWPRGAPAPHHPSLRVSAGVRSPWTALRSWRRGDGSVVYVVYGNTPPLGRGDAEDILLTLSTDRGVTWSTPLQLNDDPSCATHWHPALSTDTSGGALHHLLRRALRRRPRGVDQGAPVAGSVTVEARGFVSDALMPFTTSREGFFLGDYIGLSFGGGTLAAAWATSAKRPRGRHKLTLP